MFNLEAGVPEQWETGTIVEGIAVGWKNGRLDVHSCMEIRRMAWNGTDGGCSLLLRLCMER
jgi:hypothetical protein